MTNKKPYEIIGPLERFDQKNEMFKRSRWDPIMLDYGKKFYGWRKQLDDRKGYGHVEYALMDTGWYVERGFTNSSMIHNRGMFTWEMKDPRVTCTTSPDLKFDVQDKSNMSNKIKKVGKFLGADLVGICELNRRWVYSHSFNLKTKEHLPFEVPDEFKYAISIGISMDYKMTKTAPTGISAASTGLGYSKMGYIGGSIAHFIRCLGYKAIPTGNDTLTSIPVAIDAGLGELGRHGLLINPKFGPRIRLCTVLTDMPLAVDQPISLGVTEFCKVCKKCAKACPSQAILDGERTDQPRNVSNKSGVLKWPINAEKCFKFWASNGFSCSLCIVSCPFNKVPGFHHDMVRWLIKQIPRLDSTIVWLDDLFGYGKPIRPDYFWK
jgi:reductive dehalogenase